MYNLTIALHGPNWICSWGPPGSTDGATEAIGTDAPDLPTRCLYAVAEALLHYRTETSYTPQTVTIRLWSREEIDAVQPFAEAYRRGKMPAAWGAQERALCVHMHSFNLSFSLLNPAERETIQKHGGGAAIETGLARLRIGVSGLMSV